jgi:carboxylate-amine ligase
VPVRPQRSSRRDEVPRGAEWKGFSLSTAWIRRERSLLTVGVEEEFLLLEPDGSVAPVAARVVQSAEAGGRIGPGFMAYQAETATIACTGLDELRSELVELRLLAADAAARAGARLVATSTPPLAAGPFGALTDNARYRELARRFPGATAAGATCACQVHVGVSDRDLAVDVLARLRPWLSTLLALTVNSPIIAGVNSGWSSTRYTSQLRWPTFRPPQSWTTAERYDRCVQGLIARGAAMDQASVYYLARLSARYPTIEIRVADACLATEDAILLAGVARALVASLIDDAHRGIRTAPASQARVSAGLLAAARDGMSTRETRLGHQPESAAANLVARLLTRITPALDACADGDDVRAGLDRVHRLGTGADRQRDLWSRAATPAAFVESLAEATVPASTLV